VESYVQPIDDRKIYDILFWHIFMGNMYLRYDTFVEMPPADEIDF